MAIIAYKKGLFGEGGFKEFLRKQIKEDRKRIRKETLRKVLEQVSIRMDKGTDDEFDNGYETAPRELYIEIAMMISKTDQRGES